MLGVQTDNLAPEVRNVFEGLGLLQGQKRTRFDQIGDVLRNCYGVTYWRGWKTLLGGRIICTRFNFYSRRTTNSNPTVPAGSPLRTLSTMLCSGRSRHF